MAIKATIFKVEMQVADMQRRYYAEHSLTVARHPSENDHRMMLRLVAFALNAEETLQFCRGLSTDDEPDLWRKNLSDEIEHWIELGQPDEKRIRQAASRAQAVSIYCYQARSAEIWWQSIQPKLQRFDHLSVHLLQEQEEGQLATLAQRQMSIQMSIQDDQLWVTDGNHSVVVAIHTWRQAGQQ